MRPDRQSGFTLAAAIFLIVILAALGAFVVTVSGLQHTSSARDLVGSHAYQAARSGIEWGAHQLLASGGPLTCADGTLGFAGTTLADFTTSVECDESPGSPYTDGGNTVRIFVLVATACNQPPCPNASPGPAYVERQLQAILERGS